MEIEYAIANGVHENFEDGKDMSESEEGGLVVEMISKTLLGENSGVVSKIDESQETENLVNKDSGREEEEEKKKKKRKKGPTINIKDMSRFVIKVCKRLRLEKSYLVWHAVACLGVSALSDLVKEVEAIQACDGQKTHGKIFWNLIKAREPNVYDEIMIRGVEFEFDHYTEIMKRGKEFEKKQLKQVVLITPRIEQDSSILRVGTTNDE